MNSRSQPWLLLIAVFTLFPLSATAQPRRPSSFGPYLGQAPPSKQSHRDLPGGPELNPNGEFMADRLKELHELHQLQDKVQDLLKDPDFIENIKNHFSEEQLRQLQEKILKGDGLAADNSWNKLLDQAKVRQKLDGRQLDILRRWAERAENSGATTPASPGLLDGHSSKTPPSPPSPSPSSSQTPFPSGDSAESSFWHRLQEGTSDWISEHMDGLAGDMIDALSELAQTEEGAPLAELLRNMKRTDLPSGPLVEEAAGLSRYLPEIDTFLHEQRGAWDEVRSIFHNAPIPSLPGMSGLPSAPSARAASSADGEGWGPGVMALLALAVFLMLVWKMAGWSRAQAERAAAEAWRLGAWPVAPDAVSSRDELIRAFEYLALLCLGPSASTCHHHELANRLADRQPEDSARRRQAADRLADLYEQARYAPRAEPLSPDELSDARHALCFLAGVTAA